MNTNLTRRAGTPVPRTSADVLNEQISALRKLMPEAFSEGKVDFDKLRGSLGEEIDSRPERYSFSWAGKREAMRILQTPSRATLVPMDHESVDFDATQNVFVEGDNLEVLKLLYKAYFGRIKMIYIDPPYNTGQDFIYPDNYSDPLDTYLKLTNQVDEAGNLLTSNPETSGRFHSTWLSMMFPRLFISRQLLCDEGVIFVSIDDYEARNLRMMMDGIYGEENFIAQLVWEKGRKNDAKLFSVGHEYIVVYAKSKSTLRGKRIVWREPKPGAQEIWDKYLELREQFGNKDKAIEKALAEWYKSLPQKDPSKALSRYKHVDKWGPWRDRDISWPGGGGPRYEVLHPKTGKPCKIPEAGWRFSTLAAMQKQIDLGLVEFREDETQPPFRKAHLHPVYEELNENGDSEDDENPVPDFDEGEDTEVGMQVMPSVIYKQSQVAVKYLKRLMGTKLFDNPKDHEVLARLIRYCTSENGDLVLDFFAGSGSTAEAVLTLNSEGKGNRRFILVQLPEPTRRQKANGQYAETEAYKAGYKTIADLAKERIRRAIKKLRVESEGKLSFDNIDTGLKVLRLAESNYKPWMGTQGKAPEEYIANLEIFTDPFVPGWTELNVIWEVLIKEGFGLNSHIERVAVDGQSVSHVTDPDKGQSFTICLDEKISLDALKALNLKTTDVFVCRDAALTDETAANLSLQCRLRTI